MKRLLLFLAAVALFLIWAELRGVKKDSELKKVHVFATNSFTAEWGPGPLIEKEFEKVCMCDLVFHSIDGAQLLIERARIESEHQAADVILGIDIFDLELAKSKLRFKQIMVEKRELFDQVSAVQSGNLVPYDWGVMAIVTKKGNEISRLKSLREFMEAKSDQFLALQDPRFSSPGKHFLIWITSLMPSLDWNNLNSKIHSHSQSWSTAYGLFTKNQVKSVWSYVTSPLYHELEENNLDYMAIPFSEGHPVQIEYFGVLENCQQCLKAEMFANFLMSDEAQKIIMTKNFMFPVIKSALSGRFLEEFEKFKTTGPVDYSPEHTRALIKSWEIQQRSAN